MTPQGGSAGRSDSQWATRAPEELHEMVSARRGWGTQRASPWALQREALLAVPRGPSTQWVTAGAPEAPCGKEWVYRWALWLWLYVCVRVHRCCSSWLRGGLLFCKGGCMAVTGSDWIRALVW